MKSKLWLFVTIGLIVVFAYFTDEPVVNKVRASNVFLIQNPDFKGDVNVVDFELPDFMRYSTNADLLSKGIFENVGGRAVFRIPRNRHWDNPDDLDFYLVIDEELFWSKWSVLAVAKGDTSFTPVLPNRVTTQDIEIVGLVKKQPKTTSGNAVAFNSRGFEWSESRRNQIARTIKDAIKHGTPPDPFKNVRDFR